MRLNPAQRLARPCLALVSCFARLDCADHTSGTERACPTAVRTWRTTVLRQLVVLQQVNFHIFVQETLGQRWCRELALTSSRGLASSQIFPLGHRQHSPPMLRFSAQTIPKTRDERDGLVSAHV